MSPWLATTAFLATNVDDLFLLTLWFVKRSRFSTVLLGQVIGFSAILLLCLVGYWGLRLLPDSSLHWLGCAPIAIGLKQFADSARHPSRSRPETAWGFAAITFANGSDNLAVYPPLFARFSPWQVAVLVANFYLLLLLCVIATRCAALRLKQFEQASLWAHRISPVVLIGIGLFILFNR